jgi:hypothetical protein
MTVNGSEPELDPEPEAEPGSDAETLPEFKLKRYRKSSFVAANASHKVLYNYYDVSSDACTIATVLDPHLKLEYFQLAGNESKEDSSTTHEPTCQHANMPTSIINHQSSRRLLLLKLFKAICLWEALLPLK